MRRQNKSYSVQGGMISNQPRKFSLDSKLTIFLAVLLVVGVGVALTFRSNSTTTLASFTKVAHAKELRAIIHHKSRHVCDAPKRGQAQCMVEVSLNANGQPLTAKPAGAGSYGPTQFHTAYNLPCTPNGAVASICSTPSTYGPQTIAIVDAGNFSSGTAGLDTSLEDYDDFYGIPACSTTNGCLDVVNQSGGSSPLPSDAGWSDEIALDVETAHMVCQTCQILLVEADDALITDLATAEETAASFNPVAISDSWGTNADESGLDADFDHPGIAVVAATGDSGSVSSGADWPADNPDVVAVSGTTLQLNADNTWDSETVWADSGGGCSDLYSAPSWQTALSSWGANGCGTFRAFGDVSADGDPNTGAAINIDGTWEEAGGTSLSTPLIASMYALTGGVSSGTVASSVPYTAFTNSDFHDITSGDDCTVNNTTFCTAATGFDEPSGLGSPDGISGFVSLPSSPVGFTATTVNQNEIDLSWDASDGPEGVSGYHVYRNGSEIATVTTTSYNDTGLTPNTTYDYYVVAYDTEGDLSEPSDTVPAFSAYPADINEDGHIDLLDLSLLANKYGQSGPNLGRADINHDGTVNLLDLSLLANSYGSE